MNLHDLVVAIQDAVGSEEDGVFGIETANRVLAKLTGKPVPAPVADLPVAATDRVDDRSEAVIATLQKEAQPYMRSLIHAAAGQGMTVKAISGNRTYEQQNVLYAQGRTAPGGIVTNARGGQSNHNFGVACDFGIFVDSVYIDEAVDHHSFSGATMDKMYSALGAIGIGLGLSWGGSWSSIKDMPHFELRPGWAKLMSEGEMLTELRRRHDAGIPTFA